MNNVKRQFDRWKQVSTFITVEVVPAPPRHPGAERVVPVISVSCEHTGKPPAPPPPPPPRYLASCEQALSARATARVSRVWETPKKI